MALTENKYSGTVTDTETGLLTVSTAGVYTVIFNLENVANGDVFYFRYENNIEADDADGDMEQEDFFYVRDAQVNKHQLRWVIICTRKFTIYGDRISGSNRTIGINAIRTSSGS